MVTIIPIYVTIVALLSKKLSALDHEFNVLHGDFIMLSKMGFVLMSTYPHETFQTTSLQ